MLVHLLSFKRLFQLVVVIHHKCFGGKWKHSRGAAVKGGLNECIRLACGSVGSKVEGGNARLGRKVTHSLCEAEKMSGVQEFNSAAPILCQVLPLVYCLAMFICGFG